MVRDLGFWYLRLFLVGLSAAIVTATARSVWLLDAGAELTPSAVAAPLYWVGVAAVIGLTATGMNSSDAQHMGASVLSGRISRSEHRTDMEQRIRFSWYAGAVAVVCLISGGLLDWMGK